jgi:putative Mn2+ efflux pump MntP
MGFSEVLTFLFIGIGLSFDSFAVSVSCGLVRKEIKFSQACIIAGSLAFFQALFPAIGWFIGSAVKNMIASVDHWIAFILLFLVGLKMIIEGLKPDSKLNDFNPLNPIVLISLSVATSIDALVVGLSYGFLETRFLFPILIIGLITYIASMLGMLFGKNIPAKRSKQSIIIGGIILIGIGTKILIEHLELLA